MARQIFINLPVADLKKSRRFFSSLGFSFNEQFSNEDAACLVIDDNIFVMLLSHRHFKQFTRKQISDSRTSTEVLLCLSCDSREEVDSLVNKAVKAGGRIPREPEDHGFMYGHAFEDLDGHIWELLYLEKPPEVKPEPQPEGKPETQPEIQPEPESEPQPDTQTKPRTRRKAKRQQSKKQSGE
jgi:predicted lactoylglutathione lyase